MERLQNFVEWVVRYFLIPPEERTFIREPRWNRSHELARLRRERELQRLEMEWQLFKDDLLDLEAQGPILPRPVWMAIYQTAISLPVSLTISLYLLKGTAPHPLFVPLMIGMVSITSFMFQFTAKLVRLNW